MFKDICLPNSRSVSLGYLGRPQFEKKKRRKRGQRGRERKRVRMGGKMKEKQEADKEERGERRTTLLFGPACSPLPISLAVTHWSSLVLYHLNPQKSPPTPLPPLHGRVPLFCQVSEKAAESQKYHIPCLRSHRINSQATWSLNPR